MSRFITENEKVALPNNDWVEVRKLSYEELMGLSPSEDEKDVLKRIQKNVELLKAVILKWNFTLDDGSAVPCTPENIAKLDVKTINELIAAIRKTYAPDEKKSMQSGNQS